MEIVGLNRNSAVRIPKGNDFTPYGVIMAY